MNTKEIAEIRRTLSDKRETVRTIHGFYINAAGEIIAEFEKSVGLMGEEERMQYFALFRRLLSGAQNKNLFDIPFTTKQVTDDPKHGCLMRIKASEGVDGDAAHDLLKSITESYHSEENYVVLIAKNRYDVVKKSKNESDGEESESTEIYTFFATALCPVRPTRAGLVYDPDEKNFNGFAGVHSIAAPEVGFVFPAFDGRRSNIYDALFYTRASDCRHTEFLQNVFGYETPIVTAKEQEDGFKETLAGALKEELSFSVAKGLHQQIADRIELHKESRDPEPLLMSKEQISECLEAAGVSEETVGAFVREYADTLGTMTELSPKNLIGTGKCEIRTPDVTIRVAPGKEDLVAVRHIHGKPYILIAADAGVELNGLAVRADGEVAVSGSDAEKTE